MTTRTLMKWWRSVAYFRTRHGYGVHAPFAYDFITDTLRSRHPYSAFPTLCQIGGERQTNKNLFRLANKKQPNSVVTLGEGAPIAAHYVAAAKRSATILPLEAALSKGTAVELVYIGRGVSPAASLEALLPCLTCRAAVVVSGVNRSKEVRVWWKSLLQDSRTGDTYDLGDLAVILFDTTHKKRNYKV